MMNLDNVTQKLAAEGITVDPIDTIKNSVEFHGLRIISPDDSDVSPIVYWLPGDTEEEYLARIRSVHNMPQPLIDVNLLTDRGYILDHVFLAVQKRSDDVGLIKRSVLNLELFMRIHIEELFADGCGGGYGTVKVNQFILDVSGMPADEIWDAAFTNTRNTLCSQSLSGLLGLPKDWCEDDPFIVLTTSFWRDGAAFLAIEDVFRELCQGMNVRGCYILPSSTDELLCLPIRDENMDPMDLARMVAEVNETAFDTDILKLEAVSYRYDLDGQIRIAASLT